MRIIRILHLYRVYEFDVRNVRIVRRKTSKNHFPLKKVIGGLAYVKRTLLSDDSFLSILDINSLLRNHWKFAAKEVEKGGGFFCRVNAAD